MIRRSRALGAISLAGVAVLGIVGPASAATAYNLNTSSAAGDGFAHSDGNVLFLDGNSVKISNNISDRCNGAAPDGEGAYAWVNLRYSDGTFDNEREVNLNFDDNGCDNGTNSKTITLNPGRTIVWVRIRLDESNGPTGTSSSTVYSPQVDNPYS